MTDRRLVAVAAGLTVLLSPGVAAANGAHGGGGPNVPLLVVAGVALVAGILVGTSKRARAWMTWGALGVALVAGGLAFGLPELGGAEGDAHVRFLEPADGERVAAREPFTVTIAVDGGRVATSEADTEGGHLHLYVDGNLEQQPSSTQFDVRLAPGSHELRIEYVDHQHVSFDPPVEATITLTAR